ncbi:MAG: XrtA-associated tyrosine autokinase [Candidatus Acidiferrum sp.]
MSRIHEALKKAAEERSAQPRSGVTGGITDVSADHLRSMSMAADVIAPPPVTDRVYTGPLRFEDIVAGCTHPQWTLDPQMSAFAGVAQGKVGAERFRTLRSRLYQIASTRALSRVVVTSSVAAEGKTFVAANLAQSIVRQPDRRVLLIDADLRASRLHLALGAPSTPGLTDYLLGEVDELSIIQKGMDANLCFIPGGREVSNPSELLLSERMKKLLDMVTPAFDWIILDSPPALPVHDASMLADLCDGVLFVVKAGETSFELAEKACAEFIEKNMLGVVLNRVEKDDSYGGNYYYGYPSEA